MSNEGTEIKDQNETNKMFLKIKPKYKYKTVNFCQNKKDEKNINENKNIRNQKKIIKKKWKFLFNKY